MAQGRTESYSGAVRAAACRLGHGQMSCGAPRWVRLTGCSSVGSHGGWSLWMHAFLEKKVSLSQEVGWRRLRRERERERIYYVLQGNRRRNDQRGRVTLEGLCCFSCQPRVTGVVMVTNNFEHVEIGRGRGSLAQRRSDVGGRCWSHGPELDQENGESIRMKRKCQGTEVELVGSKSVQRKGFFLRIWD